MEGGAEGRRQQSGAAGGSFAGGGGSVGGVKDGWSAALVVVCRRMLGHWQHSWLPLGGQPSPRSHLGETRLDRRGQGAGRLQRPGCSVAGEDEAGEGRQKALAGRKGGGQGLCFNACTPRTS